MLLVSGPRGPLSKPSAKKIGVGLGLETGVVVDVDEAVVDEVVELSAAVVVVANAVDVVVDPDDLILARAGPATKSAAASPTNAVIISQGSSAARGRARNLAIHEPLPTPPLDGCRHTRAPHSFRRRVAANNQSVGGFATSDRTSEKLRSP